MSDNPVDLSSLDPTRDPLFQRRVRSIVTKGMRARRPSVTSVIASWAMPALVAATIVTAVPVAALVRAATERRAPTTAEILGIPPALVRLVASTPQPSLEDIAVAIGAGAAHGR